jgi:hypothetical protein
LVAKRVAERTVAAARGGGVPSNPHASRDMLLGQNGSFPHVLVRCIGTMRTLPILAAALNITNS